MAVAEMRKLNLIAMAYDRDALLNALQKTGATEIKQQAETENTAPLVLSYENLQNYLGEVESALFTLTSEMEAYNAAHKIKSDILNDGFEVSYEAFMGAHSLKGVADETVAQISKLADEKKKLLNEQSKLEKEIISAEIYSQLKIPFSDFSDTKHVKIKLGIIPVSELDNLKKCVCVDELCEVGTINVGFEYALIWVVWHKTCDCESALSSSGFVSCPYRQGTGEELYNNLKCRSQEICVRLSQISDEFVSLGDRVQNLKIYCDYLSFELEKLTVSEKFRVTNATFLLEAYVPKEAESAVSSTIDGVSSAIFYEFSDPDESEMPPTLYKNNKVVQNFETITNMYSPVNAKEFDPNTIMAFFYSLFLGFIMGDVGYGILMFLGGGFIYIKKRREDGGFKRLSGVFAIGGIFAILWGLLLNSFFGLTFMFPTSVIPDVQESRWSLMGISIPSVLLISLEIGVVHIMFGYICKAIQCMRRGYFWDGMLDGFVWAVFSIGAFLAIIGLIEDANVPQLAYIGGAMVGASLVVAVLTAGRKEKLLGKFTKGFGAVYGIINYVSDILSYARLYGLMLSGAVVAKIVSDYSIGFITGGNVAFIMLGVVLMVVGHIFNLAIGLLGAYIHDARLQYVEFYGKFYEGEGKLFAPLGSNNKYTKLANPVAKSAD